MNMQSVSEPVSQQDPKIEWKLNQPECGVSYCDGHSVDCMARRTVKTVPGPSFLFFFPAG